MAESTLTGKHPHGWSFDLNAKWKNNRRRPRGIRYIVRRLPSAVPIFILGAGPAGLGAAYKLARRGCFDVTVFERNKEVGGNAGSFPLDGLQVDFGSHRLHPSCAPEILADIGGMLGDGLLDRPRHGRIRLRGRWLHFPLKPLDLAAHAPPPFLLGALRDALIKPRGAGEETFQTVLERGLGRTICRDFYFPYAKKIWGVPPEQLDAEQARRRVSASSTGKMIQKIFKGKSKGRFFYPRDGYGAISEAYAKAAAASGARVSLGTPAPGIHVENGRVVGPRQILSTIPVTALARAMNPEPPRAILESACALQFRAMILIYLVLDADQFTEFDAHYFPDADIAITRLSEPKNYGLAGVAGRTVLCAELPCSIQDGVWSATDAELGMLMRESLAAAGIPVKARVRQVVTRRLPQAYPIYTRDYREHFDRIDGWLNQIDGLVTFGRQGLFAHDNTHHALAMAYALDKCLNEEGTLDRERWGACRREFEKHVVED